MRGRLLNGKFQAPFNPLKWGDAFTEGNAWHYTWSVFHDPQGLMRLMGGKDRFNQMLDSVFQLPPVFDDSYYGFTIHEIREMQVMNMGNYAHGNQPIQHGIYLYGYSGQPWKSQYWVRQVMDRLYTPTPDGYCGDEDNGQTSAWYVFSAMGFYPVCPGTGQYVLGTPYFQKMKLHLENGKQINILADGNGCYIDEMQLNGQLYERNYLDMNALKQGANISFRLSESLICCAVRWRLMHLILSLTSLSSFSIKHFLYSENEKKFISYISIVGLCDGWRPSTSRFWSDS